MGIGISIYAGVGANVDVATGVGSGAGIGMLVGLMIGIFIGDAEAKKAKKRIDLLNIVTQSASDNSLYATILSKRSH